MQAAINSQKSPSNHLQPVTPALSRNSGPLAPQERLPRTIPDAEGTSGLKQAKLAGTIVSWSTDITNPVPLTPECSGTVEGNAMAGQVKLGLFDNAGSSASAADCAVAGLHGRGT